LGSKLTFFPSFLNNLSVNQKTKRVNPKYPSISAFDAFLVETLWAFFNVFHFFFENSQLKIKKLTEFIQNNP
jgi:hypothetical protein